MKKFLSFILVMAMVLSVSGVAMAADMNFSDAAADESGTGWAWDYETGTLTLSGAVITEQVTLPASSKIVVTAGTENSIAVTGAAAISASGELNISGAGKLAITAVGADGYHSIQGAEKITVDSTELSTYGFAGLYARYVDISNAKVDIRGYGYGISYNDGTTGSSKVTLTNVSGSIIGELDCGIELYMEYNADNSAADKDVIGVYIKDCSNLTIKGEPERVKSSNSGHRSAIWLYTRDAETDCVVEIEKSDLELSGSGGGIYVNSHSDNSTSDDASSASVTITNSNVDIETITDTWAAIFANNNGTGENATASIDIEDSVVKALCPNDVAVMTSTKDADSKVTVDNSTVEMSGKVAGIRAKANMSDAGEAIVKNSSILVLTGEVSDEHKTVDEMDNGNSTDGSDGISDDSVVIKGIDDTELTINQDGTVSIPEGGKVEINGEEYCYPEGAKIHTNGEVEDFYIPDFSIVLVATPTDGGTVDGEGVYDEGTDVTVTASANEGYRFVAWTENGVIVSEDEEYTFTVTENCELVAVFEEVEEEPEAPVITHGMNGEFDGENDLTFRSNADFADFECVKVDGNVIDEDNYTVSEGSTVVILKAAYLKTLSVGVHELAIVSETGEAKTNFTVKAAAEEEPPEPTKPDRKDIKVKYEGGNTFSTSKSAVPTSVEIDGVPVSFVGDGRSFTVSCIEPGNHWITVRWHSTSVTTNFTADASVVCIPNAIPKTGDVSVMAYALMAVIAAAGVMRKK